MRPGHIHNHLRLCLGSHRIYEQTGMLGMQPELLCPRRSRFAPKTHRWDIPIFEFRNANSKIQNRVEGYVKEHFCLKFKQFQVVCQLFYSWEVGVGPCYPSDIQGKEAQF